ncbi:uncharacterized protein LOC123502027 [Portunus trituberculatus]|uniref:uncharacterized protein LOC123502027 n=1 Tax=Portunus trituberculatus TaxID=210409 RepID=UPI001E1CE1B5|nr:uncharacterized protein LOC123502027 [Portunus trituberculatus]
MEAMKEKKEARKKREESDEVSQFTNTRHQRSSSPPPCISPSTSTPSGEGPATPKLDAISQAVSNILGDGNVTLQRHPEGTDSSTLYHPQLKGDRSQWDHSKKEHELRKTVDGWTPVSDPYKAVSDPNKVVIRTSVSDPNK